LAAPQASVQQRSSAAVCPFWRIAAGTIGLAALLVACTKGGQITQASRERDPVGQFIRDRMQPASAAFFVPSPAEREQPIEAVLEISPPATPPEQLEREVRADAAQQGVSASASIKIAARMIANLTADRPCTITATDPLDRAIPLGAAVRWRWVVTPKDEGPLRLTATLTAPVMVDGKETGYTVKSLDQTVTVTVTSRQRAKDLLQWSKDYWVILTACVTAIGALIGWLRRRRRKPDQQ
jgi:hypothetical protein